MTNKYTSLDLSRLIQSKVPEVETGMWYVRRKQQGKRKYQPEIYDITSRENCCDYADGYCLHDWRTSYPAYRLDDVLRAIKVWGEKQGWRIMDMGAGDNFRMTEDPFYAHQHRLITAYLDDGLQFGDRSEKVIRSIFEV